jgi:hypothetical protein
MMLVTIVEDGDIIVVDKEGSVLTQDSHYYIKKNGVLVEVEWYEASRYQADHKQQVKGDLWVLSAGSSKPFRHKGDIDAAWAAEHYPGTIYFIWDGKEPS